MEEIIEAVEKATLSKNWYGALFIALTIPDICGKIETPCETSLQRYISWFNKYLLVEYNNYLNAEDCYALRCALLHEGSDSIKTQSARKALEHILFLTDGAHKSLFNNCNFNGKIETFLQLRVDLFCKDVCESAKSWLKDVSTNTDAVIRLSETVKIHEPGFVYGGVSFG